jgi:hypothetical protein
MPTIIIEGYKFRFYSSDVNEPPHVHILRDKNVAKIWLESLEVEYQHGYKPTEINRIIKLTRENKQRLLEIWNGYFNK